jgi:hypothetical protein
MAKTKVELKGLIENINSRRIAYSKRKRALVKKAIELSVMCDTNISITIFDKTRQKLAHYSSSFDFNPKVASQLLDPNILPQLTYNIYSNSDYQTLHNQKQIS